MAIASARDWKVGPPQIFSLEQESPPILGTEAGDKCGKSSPNSYLVYKLDN